MISYQFKKEHHLIDIDRTNLFQKKFAIAIKNWEINQQEDRLISSKPMRNKK